GNKQMEPPKWTGAVSSYAGKYALQGLFAIGEKDVDEYPSEENQQQQDQNNQQNQVKYIDNIQYQEILKTVEEFATVKGAPFDTVANFVLNKYQIQDFHQVPVDGYNVVMEYLNTQIQKAYQKQGV
ncbi:ERF family protein, partial [Streptococcus suis]